MNKPLAFAALAEDAALYRALKAWQTDTGAAIPSGANPNYDPKAERPRGKQGSNSQSGQGGKGKKKSGSTRPAGNAE